METIRIGLLTDPGLSTEAASALVGELPGELERRFGGEWRVEVEKGPVALDENGEIPLTALAGRLRSEHAWDLLLCVTDLPRRWGTRTAAAEVSTTNRVALASLPAVGAFRLRAQLREMLLHLVGELTGKARRRHRVFAPSAWVDRPEEDVDAFLTLTGVRGRLRLLTGMVRANRPWRLVPELSGALAAAAAMAAFGVFYNSIWSMADALSPLRLTVISLLAVTAMVGWLIAYNGLWERPGRSLARAQAELYNTATVLTLFVGVVCMYVILVVATTLSAVAVITMPYLEQTLGHPAGIGAYLKLAWLASSMGTVAGALGSSLETDDAVRRATYSKRERERRARRDERQRAEENG